MEWLEERKVASEVLLRHSADAAREVAPELKISTDSAENDAEPTLLAMSVWQDPGRACLPRVVRGGDFGGLTDSPDVVKTPSAVTLTEWAVAALMAGGGAHVGGLRGLRLARPRCCVWNLATRGRTMAARSRFSGTMMSPLAETAALNVPRPGVQL